jgi:sec-independent protein translocase protein TatA
MFGMGPTELIIIMFIILILFGAKKLPELAQGLGKGIREFKRASNEIQDELNVSNIEAAKKTQTPEAENKTADKKTNDTAAPDDKFEKDIKNDHTTAS